MKTNSFKKLFFALTIVIVAFSSCITDNDSVSKIEQVENNVQAGDWKISYFNDSGVDETSNFSGYSFTFQTDGSLIAHNVSNTYTGTWSITNSDINDDSSSPNDLDFNIFFNLTNLFSELNEDWDIVSYSSTKVELMHVSGGNGGTDYLTFVKI